MDADSAAFDFFVSYTARDRARAEWVGACLREAGCRVAMQASDIRPGDDFIQKMDSFIARSRATVLVLSRATLASPWVRREVSASIAKDPDGGQRTLIPVRIEDCDPTGLLGPIVYADLVGLDDAHGREVLLAAVAGASAAAPATAALAPPAPEASTAQLRRRLQSAFDAAGFAAFCLDIYPAVYERFTPGMTLDQMHTLLLDHCRRSRGLAELAQHIGRDAAP